MNIKTKDIAFADCHNNIVLAEKYDEGYAYSSQYW